MKFIRTKYGFLILLLMLLGACGPLGRPSATAPASLVPVDLAGPQMKVGSTFLYADGTVLVPVPEGPFTMGADGPDNPKHQVTLGDFWIYSTKVTNVQFAYCVAMGQCTPPLKADDPGYTDSLHSSDPMVGVTYDQAAAYCSFTHARLPTEAEWEKTARGPNANIYPWGNGAPSCDVLNFGDCVGSTTPVNKYPAGRSYYGAFDMEGNALEWVADWYGADYYSNAPAASPLGPDHAHDRVVRSSAFNSGADQLLAAMRFHSAPDTHRSNLSFRCVVDNPTFFAPFCNYPATYGTAGIGGPISGPQTVVVCADLTIVQVQTCIGPDAVTTLKFPDLAHNSPGAYEEDATGCDRLQPGDPPEWQCTQNPGQPNPARAWACAQCTTTLTSQPLCPSGYTLHRGRGGVLRPFCSPNGGAAGACLAGFTLNPGAQCCTVDPNAPTPSPGTIQYVLPAICPAGTSFDGNECSSVHFRDDCNFVPVEFASCTTGGGGGLCQPPPGGCGGGLFVWDQNSCSCVNSSP